jgi:hypothetical protein
MLRFVVPLVQSSHVERFDHQAVSTTLFPLHQSCVVAAESRVTLN